MSKIKGKEKNICDICNGTGAIHDADATPCSNCNTTGKVHNPAPDRELKTEREAEKGKMKVVEFEIQTTKGRIDWKGFEFEIEGLKFVVAHSLERDLYKDKIQWRVTEPITGMAITGNCSTRKEAIKEGKRVIKFNGIEKVKEAQQLYNLFGLTKGKKGKEYYN